MKAPVILVMGDEDGPYFRAVRSDGEQMDFHSLEDAKRWAGHRVLKAEIAPATCSTQRRWAPAVRQHFTEVTFSMEGERFVVTTTN